MVQAGVCQKSGQGTEPMQKYAGLSGDLKVGQGGGAVEKGVKGEVGKVQRVCGGSRRG